jgi:uncharacterized repeat protein (TIGR01451 family)
VNLDWVHPANGLPGCAGATPDGVRLTTRCKFAVGLLAMLGIFLGMPVCASGVPPGTQITNTVAVSFVQDGVTSTGSASNTVVVDQLVDVVATWQDGTPVLSPAGADDSSLLFKVTNTGNGSDSYALELKPTAATGDDFAATGCRLYLDRDKDGTWSDADVLYVRGSNDPSIDPDASVNLLAVCDIPKTAGDHRYAHAQLVATSKTLSGAPGNTKASAGIDGVDVIVGASGGAATADGAWQASNVTYELASTQVVTDQSGGHISASGSEIAYQLVLSASGSATGRNLKVVDPIPDHTSYVAGTLTLDGTPLGDGNTDRDPGDYNLSTPNAITVRLGSMAGSAAPRVISFRVRIN